jgi:hypothetical protein
MKATDHEWRHDDLAADLAGYLRQPERMVWCDMQLGPSGSPRPDVFTMQKSYSKPAPAAFEVKISRSDLRSDTTSGKWQSYLKFAGSVTFAVPDGLCTVGDIPDGCGLMFRKDQVWRYARRPTIQRVTLPADAYMKLLIDGVGRIYRPALPEPRKAETWRDHEVVRARFGDAVARAARDIVAVQSSIDGLKDHYRYQLEKVKEQVDGHRKMLMRQAEEEIPKLTAIRDDLCAIFGIEPGSDPYAIRHAASRMKAQIDADKRVQEAEERVSQARSSLSYALERLGQAEASA